MMTIDLGQLAREVELPVEQVQAVVELLDAGNTVPFIARFRKDQIGGLLEDQVRRIQNGVIAQRSLADRKEAILRAIEAQGKLSAELKEKIEQTHSLRRLEDIFLPFKPKKQTLGSLAKERGLEPLSREILHASPAAADLDARAKDFVNPDRELNSPAEVLLGVGHLLAEHFSEHTEARTQLRRTFWRTARMVCKPGEAVEELKELERQAQAEQEALRKALEAQRKAEAEAAPPAQPTDAATDAPAEGGPAPAPSEGEVAAAAQDQPAVEQEAQAPAGESASAQQADAPSAQATEAAASPDETAVAAPSEEAPVEDVGEESPEEEEEAAAAPEASAAEKAPSKAATAQALARKKAKDQLKRRKRQKAVQTFRDFFDMREPIKNLTPQRVLSINRGERVRALEVTIEADVHAMQKQAEDLLVPADHPHADFLRACVHDAVARLIVPSLVQEARRELNDEAENYAIKVYSENLKELLLQKPIRGRRILAIEPGYRKGCKIAAVDEVGRVLGVGMLQVVGREDWRKKGRERLVEIIQKHNVTIVAIGDGPGSREVERMVTDVLENDLKDAGVEYTIVPEAGAAAYGTSPLAREELSKYDPSHRIAISIARRLLDPLAELVKVSPANIEVGPAHYDIKTKLLRDTLDNVVESVVSYVGVDVNRANPALLRYVSGMNQLTARRVYEYREHYGPLRNREQLKNIPGIDEKTYRQAAGFMKVTGGDNPLDATWIHPDDYDAANKVLEALGLTLENVAPPAPKPKAFAEEVLAEPAQEQPANSPEASTSSQPTAEEAPAPTSPEGATEAVAVESPAPAEATEAPSGETSPTSEVATPAAQEAEVATPPGDAPAEAPAAEAPAEESPAAAPEASEAASSTEAPAAESAPAAISPAPAVARTVEAAVAVEPIHSASVPVPLPVEIPFNEEVERRSADWDLDQKANELGIGKFLLRYILDELARPGRDPRDAFSPPPLRSRRMSLDDVHPSMELKGTVVSVVDFGAFVDIGLSESGLVHISRLANRFVRDAHDEVAVGDVIQVWVVDIDKNRGRVSLTAIPPGTERPRDERRDRPKKDREGQTGERRPRQQRRDQGKKGNRAPRQPAVYVVQSKKPAKPISKKMIEGKEPLRSFSDLQQFFQKKREGSGEEEQK